MEQKIIASDENYEEFTEWLNGRKKAFLVCDKSISLLTHINKKLNESKGKIIRFSDFEPNPLYESVVEGVEIFRIEKCDSIIAIGGGSAIDVAKCIKLYSNMAGNGADGGYLKQEIIQNSIPFLAVPTTAGTGSEATKYAVIYYNGKKQSITHENCIPSIVVLDPGTLKTLSLYQKKSTMLDALCHAIESFWSVNSTKESKEYSRSAICGVLENMEGYLANTKEGNAGMLMAAHTAGKAINIAQTTAGHAMCYKITSSLGVAHGHAAALCVRKIWPLMIKYMHHHCSDSRGKEYLNKVFEEIAEAMGCISAEQAAWRFNELFLDLDMDVPDVTNEEAGELADSVNPIRLKNNPVGFSVHDFYFLYGLILNSKEALADKLVIKVASEMKKYFKKYGIQYDRSADPERIIIDYMANRKSGIPAMSGNDTVYLPEFQKWRKRLGDLLAFGDKLLRVLDVTVEDHGYVTIDFEVERDRHRRKFTTRF